MICSTRIYNILLSEMEELSENTLSLESFARGKDKLFTYDVGTMIEADKWGEGGGGGGEGGGGTICLSYT